MKKNYSVYQIRNTILLIFFVALFSVKDAYSQQNPAINAQEMQWQVANTTRKALVYIPKEATSKKVPVIFAFHGHGGTMYNMYRTRRFDTLWPEAIFICPQGLNTPGKLTDPEGKKSGWEMSVQDITNKDLAFFDAMLKTLKENYQIDTERIYATGHSNGGGFTYLLWAKRGDVFAAVAPTATTAVKLLGELKPKPVFHLMGEKDPLVKPEWQRYTCNKLLQINQCDETNGEKKGANITFYPSKTGNPVELFVHPGGHEYPREANEAIIEFFKLIGY